MPQFAPVAGSSEARAWSRGMSLAHIHEQPHSHLWCEFDLHIGVCRDTVVLASDANGKITREAKVR